VLRDFGELFFLRRRFVGGSRNQRRARCNDFSNFANSVRIPSQVFALNDPRQKVFADLAKARARRRLLSADA
jgi:hypothetical protein